jgi:hypothetical protein
MSAPDAVPLPRAGEVFFDIRGSSRSMRLSWYADTGVAVFSIWQGGRCTGTFRLPMDELPRMVETLRRGPGQRPADGGPAAGQRADPEPMSWAGDQARVPVTGYEYEQPAAGYTGHPAAGYPDLPAVGYREPTTARYPDHAAGYPDQTIGYDQPAASYDPPAAGRPARTAAAYPGQPGTDYLDGAADYLDGAADYRHGAAGSRAQPGDGYPERASGSRRDRAAGYPAEPGRGYPGRQGRDSFTTTGQLDFPSVPSGRDGRDERGRTPADLPSADRDNRDGAGAGRSRVPSAESFPYGQPPENSEPPQQRRDTRSSLR